MCGFGANNLQKLYSTEVDWLANESPLLAAVVDALKDVQKDPRFTTEISNFYMSRYHQLARATKVDPAALMPDGKPYNQLAPTLQLLSLRAGYVFETGKDPVFVRYEVPYSGPTPATPPPVPNKPELPQGTPIWTPPEPTPETLPAEPTPAP